MILIKKIYFKKINLINYFYFINQNKFILKLVNNTFYFCNYNILKFFFIFLKKFFNIKYANLNFKWFKFNLFMGLGFKKKISKIGNYLYIYIGDRHWLVFKIPKNIFFFPFRRRNFIIFSNSKTSLYYFNNLIKELKFISIFKLKGFVDVRTRRRWLFVRRLKVKGVKLKLSKKQKLI